MQVFLVYFNCNKYLRLQLLASTFIRNLYKGVLKSLRKKPTAAEIKTIVHALLIEKSVEILARAFLQILYILYEKSVL